MHVTGTWPKLPERALKSRTVCKGVLSRSYDITYIISERDIRLAFVEIGAILSTIVKVQVLSQQTNLSWHACSTVCILSRLLAELMTEAAASVASMVDTPLPMPASTPMYIVEHAKRQ